MIRPQRLFRALALAAAYLLAVEGVVASAAAGVHAAQLASFDGGSVLCGSGSAPTNDQASFACDDLCRLATSVALETSLPALDGPHAVRGDGAGPARSTKAIAALRLASVARGPPAALTVA